MADAVVGRQAPSCTPARQTAIRCADPRAKAAVMRTALVVGSMMAAVVAWLVASGAVQTPEPDWAVLLRGMAAIKGLLAVSAAGLVWWRLGQPVSVRAAVAYIACVWALVAATLLLWHLAFILAAAALFHAAGFVGLVLALREGHRTLGVERQASSSSIEPPA